MLDIHDKLELQYLLTKLSAEDAETVRNYLEGDDLERLTVPQRARLSRAVHALACLSSNLIKCDGCKKRVPASECSWNSFAAVIRKPSCLNCETTVQRDRRRRVENDFLVDHPTTQIERRLIDLANGAMRHELVAVARRLFPRIGLVAPSVRPKAKRTMTKEQRARISEAARAYWTSKRAAKNP
jgi:hypothetical protein